jgi:hypothetical protein
VADVELDAPMAAPAFADHFPQSCPPPDAEDARGPIYRVVKSDPPGLDDLETFFEMGEVREGRECECCGISVFRAIDDAFAYSEKFPYLGELVAMATLLPEHGKTRPTPRPKAPSHTTWWPTSV